MQPFDDLVSSRSLDCLHPATSKKRALEALAQLLLQAPPPVKLSETEIFTALFERERLGSTGLGHGVALPHGRMAALQAPVGAFMTLAAPIDFDTLDNEPVDLLFALLVPENCTEGHLQLLAQLAKVFADPDLRARVRACQKIEQLSKLLIFPELASRIA